MATTARATPRLLDTFNTPAKQQAMAQRKPGLRDGQPDAVTRMLRFLASHLAPFLAGTIIQVSGGQGLF